MRPLVCVFLPDRLELVKGPPALRRSHLDQVVAASWPARSATRRAYAPALAQRNALLARDPRAAAPRAARCRPGTPSSRATGSRCATTAPPSSTCSRRASPRSPRRSGSARAPSCATGRARARPTPTELAAELAERVDSDLERGFTGHGPHRDDVALLRDGRELRAYGSQGEQRLALLALLLAEREALAAARDAPPLMLLDDVMSELDPDRRGAARRPAARRRARASSRRPTSPTCPAREARERHAAGRRRRRRSLQRRGGRGVRRRAPRGRSRRAVEALTQRLAPATLLADVQRVWEQAAGAGDRARPRSPSPSATGPSRCCARRPSGCRRSTSWDRSSSTRSTTRWGPIGCARCAAWRPRRRR